MTAAIMGAPIVGLELFQVFPNFGKTERRFTPAVGNSRYIYSIKVFGGLGCLQSTHTLCCSRETGNRWGQRRVVNGAQSEVDVYVYVYILWGIFYN